MSKTDTFFCCAFAFCIFFPMRAPTYCLELYGGFVLIDTFRKRNILTTKIPAGYLFLFAYFLINLLSILLSEDKSGTWTQIEKRISFILIPLLLLMRRAYLSPTTIKKAFYFFIFGCLASSVIDFLRALYRSISISEGNVTFNAAIVDGKNFFDSIVYGGNYFFYEDYSWFMHPTYFSFYILFSICIIFYFLYYDRLTTKRTGALVILTAWFLLNIYLLSSRAVLLSAILVLSFWIFYFLKRKSLFRMLYGGIFLTIVMIVIIVSNPRINLLFRVEEFFDNNQRLQIWRAGLRVIKSNFPWGTGVLDLREDLEQACKSIGFLEGAELKYNLHNQYLETLAGSGILGLIILLAIIVSFLKEAIQKSNYLLLQLILIVSFNFLFESMFNVYSGIVFICFWSSLLVNYSHQPLTNNDIITVNKI